MRAVLTSQPPPAPLRLSPPFLAASSQWPIQVLCMLPLARVAEYWFQVGGELEAVRLLALIQLLRGAREFIRSAHHRILMLFLFLSLSAHLLGCLW
jgi:hypothetical protein